MKPTANGAKWMGIVGAFLVFALGFMALGFHLAGFDIIAWFSSKWAFIVYFFLGSYAILFLGVLITAYVKEE